MKDKILADNVQALRAFDVWSATGDFNTPGISTYFNPAMNPEYGNLFVQYHAVGKLPMGTVHYYDRKVLALNSHGATVLACEDGRKAYDVYAKTGKEVPNSRDGIMAFFTTVIKDSHGVWQAVSFDKEKAPASVCAAP